MITQYDVTKKLEIRGEKADLQLGIRAFSVEAKDAIAASDAFDRFLGTISNAVPASEEIGNDWRHTSWSDPEKAILIDAPDWIVGWDRYREAFPTSTRNRGAIRKEWEKLHKTKKSALKADPPAPPAAAAAKPTASKKVKTASRRVKANAKNSKATPWSLEEKVVINRHLTDKDATAVQKDYRETFPDSKRNDNSVYLKWYSAQKNAKKAAKKAPKKSDDGGSRIEKPDSSTKTLPEDPANGARCQEVHISDVTETPGAKEQLMTQAVPGKTPATTAPVQQADRDWVRVPNTPITVNTTVKHNGTKHSPFFGQVGTIVKVGDGQQILVNFGDAGSTWVMQSDVIVVTKPARTEVTA